MRKMNHFVSEIFAEPETWGLRGDPFLWEYLKKYYADIEIPYSIEQFHSEILLTFQEFTGRPLEKGEQYMASEFAKVHAGMSTGQLDGSFWIDKAIPLLLSRLKKLNDESDFPFYDAPNVATIICCHILDDGKPILYVSHDEDDGMWQFLCGSAHETAEARLVSLKSVFDLDHSVGVLKDMPCGCYAERKTQKDNWIVKKR